MSAAHLQTRLGDPLAVRQQRCTTRHRLRRRLPPPGEGQAVLRARRLRRTERRGHSAAGCSPVRLGDGGQPGGADQLRAVKQALSPATSARPRGPARTPRSPPSAWSPAGVRWTCFWSTPASRRVGQLCCDQGERRGELRPAVEPGVRLLGCSEARPQQLARSCRQRDLDLDCLSVTVGSGCKHVAMVEQAAAGWYPDEHGNERYWDGSSWAEQVRPPGGTDPTATTKLSSRRDGTFSRIGAAVKKAAADKQAAKEELTRNQARDAEAAGTLVTSGIFGDW